MSFWLQPLNLSVYETLTPLGLMLARRQTPFVVAFSGCQSGEHILAEALKR